MRHITLIVAVVALAVAAPAFSERSGNGNGHANGNGNVSTPDGACTASGSVVSATGLPTDEVINFMIDDSSGSWGWVLGFTDNGTVMVGVPAANGPTTYAFVSRTWGPDGSKYDVFASCSA
jgi:hypothetical protein